MNTPQTPAAPTGRSRALAATGTATEQAAQHLHTLTTKISSFGRQLTYRAHQHTAPPDQPWTAPDERNHRWEQGRQDRITLYNDIIHAATPYTTPGGVGATHTRPHAGGG